MAQATTLAPQALASAAKALVEAYNDKNWDRFKGGLTQDFLYDEVGTGRTLRGVDQVLEAMKGWAKAIPDSKGAIQRTRITDDGAAVLELTWSGTHQGPLQTPKGTISPTGKRIEVRACMVIEFAGDKARAERHYFDMATLLGQLGVMS